MTGAIVINGGTVTDSTPLLSLSQTWNDAADTFHLDTANVTNTASQAASTLLRRQVGGVTRFSVGVDGKITLLAQSYPAASISSTANANYGFGFNAGSPNVIANNQEAGAGVFIPVAGTSRPSWGVPSLNITGYSSAPSGSGYTTGAFLASLAPYQLTLGYTQATTPNDHEVKAHDVTNGTAAKLTLSGGNAVTTGTGGAVHVKGGTGASGDGATILGSAAGAIGFFDDAGATQAAGNTANGVSATGVSSPVLEDTTFDGGVGGGAYTIGGLIAALKAYNLIA